MAGPLYIGLESEGKYTPDFLKWEEDNHYSREEGVYANAAATELVLEPGTVFESEVPGEDIIYDGTGTITGILFNKVIIPPTSSRPIVKIVRMAVIDKRGLVLNGVAEATVLAGIASALPTILVREGA